MKKSNYINERSVSNHMYIKKRTKSRSITKKTRKKNISVPSKPIKKQDKNWYNSEIEIKIKIKKKSSKKQHKLQKKSVKNADIDHIFDTWNPVQFKTKPSNILIPFNPKFPIKKIVFNENKFVSNSSFKEVNEKENENSINSLILKQNVILEKLSIENLRKDLKVDETPKGFHQMFVSMANEFSPSWRDQLLKIMK